MNVTGNLDLVDTDQFKMNFFPKSDIFDLLSFDCGNCQSLINQRTGEFLVPKATEHWWG